MPHGLPPRSAALPRPWMRLVILAILPLVAACTGAGATTPPPGGSPAAGACPLTTTPATIPGWETPETPSAIVPIPVNSELVCGENRFLLGLVDKDGRPIGGPDTTVKVALFDLGRDPGKPTAALDTTFIWAIQDVRAMYVATASFDEAGVWGAEVSVAESGGEATVVRVTFDVRATGTAKRVGDRAPASKTPTLADVGDDVTRISTDPHPDKRLYETSVDRAEAAGKPFVLVFATPKFCASAQCGPTLDRVKPFLDAYPTVTFINVEPYKLVFSDGSLKADTDPQGQLQAAAVTQEWGIQSEPWVYVVDRSGVIRASLEGVFADSEMKAALDEMK